VGVPDLFNRVAPVLRGCLSRCLRGASRLRGSKRLRDSSWPRGSRWRPDPRATGLRRGARIVITVWVVCVLPLLTLVLGYLLLHLPEINRALWQSATHAAYLTAGALTGHKYAAATADSAGVALALMSIAGSLYVAVGLVRRATAVGLRWSDGHPRRR